jgi:DNA-binding LytR/AlgR family response regulator
MAEPQQALLHGRRLLIVEDEYLLAIELAGALEEYGAEIAGLAGSVADAQEVIQAEGGRLDAAVLDVNLGQDRVYPVVDTLQERGIFFVFVTGYDPWVISEKYSEVPRFQKPVQAVALARLLAERVACNRSSREQ